MEDKNMKRSFSLLITIILVVVFATFSLSILENNTISSNINKLKYLHLQANIHLKKIEDKIAISSNSEIDNLTLNDNRYNMKILKKQENNTTMYHVSIASKDEPIRLYKIIEKK